MDNLENENQETLLFSLADFKRLCKKWKRPILKGAITCAALTTAFTLLRPLKYTSEATFYEKTKSGNSQNKNAALLLLGEDKDSSAVVMLASQKILEAAIKKVDFQASIEPYSLWPSPIRKVFRHLNYAKQHLIAEGAHLRKSEYPSIEEEVPELVARKVVYAGEVPQYLTLSFASPQVYSVVDSAGQQIGEGKLGVPFNSEAFSFILDANAPEALESRHFELTLKPLRKLALELADNLKVASDYTDKSFITLTLDYYSRHNTSALLNSIMEAYCDHLRAEHHHVVANQVNYLKERRRVMEGELATLMHEHAERMSAHAGNLELLISTQRNLQKKLLSIDLEIKHIQKALDEGSYLQAQCSSDNDPPFVHRIMSEIRTLRQQCDSLDLALSKMSDGHPFVQNRTLGAQWAQLAFIRQSFTEAQLLLTSLKNASPFPEVPLLASTPKYRVTEWIQKLSELQESGNDPEEHADFSRKFSAYLTYLVHLLQVHEKTLQNRLIHQQNSEQEFQGINLETANTLYLAYTNQMHEAEAELSQKQFIIDKIQRPDFELSSLSTVLTDPVSGEIVKKASLIALSIKDQENRSQKELERLKQDLEIQRNFLVLHLQQIIELLKLRVDLLHSKIAAIHGVTFELLQQKISLQEKHLLDYATSRLNNLKHEHALIYEQKQALQQEFDKLPEQWAGEKLLDLALKTDGSIMQHIGSLIESKNIADHLEMSLSAPFDLAVAPLHPKSPHLLLYALLGAALGGLGVIFYALLRSIKEGIEATEENLQRAGQQVAGTLTRESFSEGNLETLRRLVSQLCPLKTKDSPSGNSMVLLEGNGIDYASQLAALLATRHLKVIVMEISFDQCLKQDASIEHKSLLDYLEGHSKDVAINNGELFDTISAGGFTAYGSELIESPLFQQLLNALREKYDWILSVSRAPLLSAEAEKTLHLFDRAALSVTFEKLNELQRFFPLGERCSYVIIEE